MNIIEEFMNAEKKTGIRTGGWTKKITPELFAKWDKLNGQKLAKKTDNCELSLVKDSAAHERYLYRPTKEGWFLNFARKTRERFEKDKEKYIEIVKQLEDKNIPVDINDVYNRYKLLVRSKQADWGSGIYCCIDKDFYSYVFVSPEEVKASLIDSYELATEALDIVNNYEKKCWNSWCSTNEDVSSAFKYLLKDIRDNFVAKVSSHWNEYKTILSARDIIDEKEFVWLLNRMIEDKISYYQRTHTVEQFLQNFEKMVDAGIKEVVLYIEAIRSVLEIKDGFEYEDEYQDFKSEEDVVFFNKLRKPEQRGNLWD